MSLPGFMNLVSSFTKFTDTVSSPRKAYVVIVDVLSDRNCMTRRASESHPSKDRDMKFLAANFDSTAIL
jgi:hypothetical protein